MISLEDRYATIRKLADRDGCVCVYCKKPLQHKALDSSLKYDKYDKSWAQIEHRLPKHLGGNNEIINLALSCKTCNSRKGTLSAPAFMYYMDKQGNVDYLREHLRGIFEENEHDERITRMLCALLYYVEKDKDVKGRLA